MAFLPSASWAASVDDQAVTTAPSPSPASLDLVQNEQFKPPVLLEAPDPYPYDQATLYLAPYTDVPSGEDLLMYCTHGTLFAPGDCPGEDGRYSGPGEDIDGLWAWSTELESFLAPDARLDVLCQVDPEALCADGQPYEPDLNPPPPILEGEVQVIILEDSPATVEYREGVIGRLNAVVVGTGLVVLVGSASAVASMGQR